MKYTLLLAIAFAACPQRFAKRAPASEVATAKAPTPKAPKPSAQKSKAPKSTAPKKRGLSLRAAKEAPQAAPPAATPPTETPPAQATAALPPPVAAPAAPAPPSSLAPADGPPPDTATTPFAAASAAAARGDFKGAARSFQSLAAKSPSAQAWFNLGTLAERQGQRDEAERAYREALKVSPDYPPSWEALARLSCRLKSCEAFVEEARKQAAESLAAVGPRIGLAQALLQLGRDEDAATAAKAALSIDERQSTAMRQLATTYLKARKWMLARMVLEAARELDPNDASIHRSLGYLYDALDERTRAIDSFARASALAPLSPEAKASYGAILVKNEDFAAGLPELEAALAAEPGDIETRLNLGNAYLGLKRIPEAVAAYQAVVKDSPKLPETYFNLGAVYLENEIPDVSTVERLRAAQGYFERYRSSGGRDDHLDEYLREVTKALQKEERRLEREKKKGTSKGEAAVKVE